MVLPEPLDRPPEPRPPFRAAIPARQKKGPGEGGGGERNHRGAADPPDARWDALPASEPTLRPAPVLAARDCSVPRDAMGLTDDVLLEVGDEPETREKGPEESNGEVRCFEKCRPPPLLSP